MTAAQASSLEEHLADKRVEELEKKLRRAQVENQLWREGMAKLRDVAVNFAPAVAHAQALEDVRAMMRSPEEMEAAISARIDREDGVERGGPLLKRLDEAKVHRDQLHDESARYAAATMRAEARVKALTEELEAEKAAEE